MPPSLQIFEGILKGTADVHLLDNPGVGSLAHKHAPLSISENTEVRARPSTLSSRIAVCSAAPAVG